MQPGRGAPPRLLPKGTTLSFTCDDLTGNEYGRLAHLIKGDPMKALLSTDSTKSAARAICTAR